MIGSQPDSFQDAVDKAVKALVHVKHEANGSFITTPSSYPSGAAVLVWIDRSPPHFLVSDYGFAAAECELMGLERRGFARRASQIVEYAGISLDPEGAIYVLASLDQLAGAIKAIASTSAEIVMAAAMRLHNAQKADARTILQKKLARLFGNKAVSGEYEFIGASATAWQIDAAVLEDDHVSLFDTVSPFFPSVASTLAKFGDIKLLEGAPRRTSVLRSREGYGSWTTALAQISCVVQAAASDATFIRLGSST